MNDWVGILGGHPQAKTPHIDKLAHQGVLFTNAHTPAPACSPCRNALFYGMKPSNSGLYPFYNRYQMNPEFFKKHKSLMELFRQMDITPLELAKSIMGTCMKNPLKCLIS